MRGKQDQIFLGLPSAFFQLPDPVRQKLASHATVRTFSKNETVIALGELAPPVVALRTGLLALKLPTEDDASVTSAFVLPTEVYSSSTRADTVAFCELVAVSASSAVVWPVEAFREALHTNSQFCMWYVAEVERRLALNYFHQARVARMSVEAQFAYFLWSLSEQTEDDNRVVRVKVTQDMVASYLGKGREEVSRKKQLLEKSGHIRQTTKGLELMPSLVALFMMEGNSPMPGEQPFHTAFFNAR